METPIHQVYFAPGDRVESGRPAVFVDRDGVLNDFGSHCRGQSFQERIYPGALESMARLMHATQMPVYVVSNQGNVNTGVAQRNMEELADLIVQAGGKFEAIYFCPDRRDRGDLPLGAVPGRKPHGGMFLAAAQHAPGGVDLGRSYMIGDSPKDVTAAKRAHAGMQTVLVRTGNAGASGHRDDPQEPDAWADHVGGAVDWIIAQQERSS